MSQAEKPLLAHKPEVLSTIPDPLTATADIIVSQLDGLLGQGDSDNITVTTAILDLILSQRKQSLGQKETIPVILTSHQPKERYGNEAHQPFLCALQNLAPHLSVETAQQFLQLYVHGTYSDYDRGVAHILARIDSQFATHRLSILLSRALKNIGSNLIMGFYVPDAIFIIHALGTKQKFGALKPLQKAFSHAETILQCEMNRAIEDPEGLYVYERSKKSDRIKAYQPVIEAILDTCVTHPTEATDAFLLNTLQHAKALALDHRSYNNYAHWLYLTVGQRIIQAPLSSSDVVFQTLSADMEAGSGFIAREACALLMSTAEKSIQALMHDVTLYTELDEATLRFLHAAAAIIHTKDKSKDIAVIVNARDFSNDLYIVPAAEAVLEFYDTRKVERSLSTPTSKFARPANFFELPDVALAWELIKIKSPFISPDKQIDHIRELAAFPFTNDRQRFHVLAELGKVLASSDWSKVRQAIGYTACTIEPHIIPYLIERCTKDVNLKQGILEAIAHMPKVPMVDLSEDLLDLMHGSN